jgi:hypothetical protein
MYPEKGKQEKQAARQKDKSGPSPVDESGKVESFKEWLRLQRLEPFARTATLLLACLTSEPVAQFRQ